MRPLLPLPLLLVALDGLVDVQVESLDLLGQALALLLELADRVLHIVLLLLSHEGFAHAVGDRTFVERLVGLDGHLDFVTHTHKQESAFGALDRNLTDQLVEALGVEFFSNRADASLSCLAGLQPFV